MNKPLRLNRRTLEKQVEEREGALAPSRLGGFSRAEALLNAVVPQNDVEGYVREIYRLWNEAKEKFLAIGDYLSLAKRQLAHGEYEAMIRSRLPFSKSAAHRMRAVAEAVRDGRLSRERLPHSYATAYELTLLSDQQLRVAEDRGLVHPKVYLSEIKAFRHEIKGTPAADQCKNELFREWNSLSAEIRRLEEQLRRAMARRLEIESEIGPELGHHSMRRRGRVLEGRAEPVEDEAANA